MLRKTALTLFASLTLFTTVAPAFAETIIIRNGRHHNHCWWERQKVIVEGRHGVRVYWKNVRVCR